MNNSWSFNSGRRPLRELEEIWGRKNSFQWFSLPPVQMLPPPLKYPLRHRNCFEISASGNGCLPGSMGPLHLTSSPGLSVHTFTFALVETISAKNAGQWPIWNFWELLCHNFLWPLFCLKPHPAEDFQNLRKPGGNVYQEVVFWQEHDSSFL